MEVNVNVKVSLEEASLNHLGKIFTACIGGAARPAPSVPAPVEVRPVAPSVPKPAASPAPQPEAPKAPEIDNMTLNKAVKAAQGRGVEADVIRGIFSKFGITSSRECPAERRQDLLDQLNELKPDMPA